MFASKVAALAMVLAAAPAVAQIKTGEYVNGAGFGVLHITPEKSAGLRFQLNARGANFHVCELSGVIRNGEALLDDSSDNKRPCIVTFKVVKEGIDVNSKFERTCSAYCGARASFEGVYATPPAGCAPSQVRGNRNRFKAMFDRKAYAEARDLLAPVLKNCLNTMSNYDEGWVRNDFALTQHRLGDNAGCRETLKPWLELAQTHDEQIRGDYPPSDADMMLRLAGATRANMSVCGAPVKIKPPAKG